MINEISNLRQDFKLPHSIYNLRAQCANSCVISDLIELNGTYQTFNKWLRMSRSIIKLIGLVNTLIHHPAATTTMSVRQMCVSQENQFWTFRVLKWIFGNVRVVFDILFIAFLLGRNRPCMIIGVAVRLVHSSLLFKATNHQLIIDNFRPCLTYNQLTILTVHQFLAIATKKGRIYVNVTISYF